MMMSKKVILFLALAAPSTAFMGSQPFLSRTALQSSAESTDSKLDDAIRRELNYQPGAAKTDFAERFKHLVGADVKTVGEAFAEFTKVLGLTVNPLYKNMVTDIVGTTHLVVVNARFKRDAVWSLGMITALDLLLKNYPEEGVDGKIVSALFQSVGLDEVDVRAEAKSVTDWIEGKSREDVEAALMGEGDSPVAAAANQAKADEYWMYSRYFGIGLLKAMETIGMEMDQDEVYPVMESWMTDKLGKSHLTACADSDLFFKIKNKLDMMETMMKEIEIREKKRMAERLEEKAEAALRAADREEKFQGEVAAEAAEKKDTIEMS